MKFFCIGDEDTARGFRLAGITAVSVVSEEEARTALKDVLTRSDCGVLLINERVAGWIRQEVDEVRLEKDRPLIVEIPGPEGPLAGRRSLRDFVQEAVGVRVG